MFGKRRDDGLENLLFAAYIGLLLAAGLLTVGRIGITWDEPNYFGSSYSYFSWFAHVLEQPSDGWASIDRFWSPSHEAPPFFKLWAGIFAGAGALVFGTENLGAIGDAYRMGSYVLFLVSVLVVYWFIRREFGSVAAWGAVVSMPLIPALFGFARLGQLDGAAASMYLISAVATCEMLMRGGRGRVLMSGVLLGLAFATKLTVFPLPIAALLWVVVYRRGSALHAGLVRLLASFGIGAATFFAIWPWLWRDPVGRTWEFLTWTGGLQNERLQYYLGEWWAGAPFHYPLAVLIAMVPLAVALAGIAGVVRLVHEAYRPVSGWILLHFSLVAAVAGSGMVPVYGGPRQFLGIFPFWALCAGASFAWIISWLREVFPVRLPAALAVYAALSLPGILWTGTENSLEYYGEAVGLAPGAAALGFETTYLADTYAHALKYVNENAPEGATVYTQAGTFAVVESYRWTGGLREDLRPAYLAPIATERYTVDREPRPGSYFLFLPRQSIYTRQMLALDEKEPLYAYEKGGVPLVKIYSGEMVGETLHLEGQPIPHGLGLLNAFVAFGFPLVILFRLLAVRLIPRAEQ